MRFALFVVAIHTAACAGSDSMNRAVRTDSSGIELVVSSGTDRLLPWIFETLHVLGGKDEGPEAFYRVWPGGVGADREGNLYVLDAAIGRIVVFNANGTVTRTLGGSGGGPGEFLMPNGLSVSAEGVSYVFDFGKRHLVRFGADGRTLEELDFPYFPLPTLKRHMGS